MKERMERFAAFPFSVGCVSQSSVDVVENQPKKSQAESNRTTSSEVQSSGRIKSSFQKVIKSLSYLFQFYKEVEEDDDDEEMVIGFPTDVKHVAHIGWDGFNSGSNGIMQSLDKSSNSEILSLPTISLEQFEMAMANQANDVHPHPPLGPH